MTVLTEQPETIRLARDALEFLDRVDREVRRNGGDEPHENHWIVAACGRHFLARAVAQIEVVRQADVQAKAALDAGDRGPILPAGELVALAMQAALDRGDDQVHALDLVRTVLQHAGIATRSTPGPGSDVTRAPAAVDADGDAPAGGASDEAGPEDGTATPDADAADDAAPAPAAHSPSPAGAAPVAATPARAPGLGSRPAALPVTSILRECGSDWTIAANRGALPPVVGRDAELVMMVEGLCRPTKPNLLLVGEPGVGKSALVEGLARRMAAGDVPATLAGRPLVALNMAELLRDSRYHGVLEARFGEVIEAARSARAVLFIDEGHAVTGAGGREGGGDIASLLKPVLARGDLSFILATTEDEYRRYILPNGALERRFNVIHVVEPRRDAVRVMLAAHRDALARTHRVTVSDAALDRILLRTATLWPHRREPDRSRDVLDQVVARAIVRDRSRVGPAEVDRVAADLAGRPDVTHEDLASLESNLVGRGLVGAEVASALADRLGTAMHGLALHPRRPRATILFLREDGGPDGLALAEAVAEGLFGGPEQVIAINVEAITEPSGISGFLGTPQGYIGHGETLPIHGLAERPNSVLLLRGVDLAHETFRRLLARGIRDGHLVDAQARRIGLTQAVIVLEAAAGTASRTGIGFGLPAASSRGGTARAATEPAPGSRHAGGRATAAVGAELSEECDVIADAPTGARGGAGWAARTLRRLEAAYREVGVALAWDPAVEAHLEQVAAAGTPRERERNVEARIGRALRPALRAGGALERAIVRLEDGRLVVDAA